MVQKNKIHTNSFGTIKNKEREIRRSRYASDTSITVSRMALVRVLRLNVIWMVYLAKPVKDATGDASREKKSQAFTCW